MVSALDDVLGELARAVVPPDRGCVRIGEITLHPHQVTALAQVEAAIAEFGGALLTDPPGLGKTFVALAAGARYPRRIVAAPAALRTMWTDAADRACVPVEFVSLEALSRGRATAPAPFLIVDEAHHVSSRSARRYRQVAELAHHARVLLLTATPVRNRHTEMTALLSFFLGPDAESADESTIARCTVCRPALAAQGRTPRVVHLPTVRPRGGDRIADALRGLPPPVALAEGDPAAGLIALSLARCWASSVASLERALWRRLQRGAAIADALNAGRLPTQAELCAWTVGDDATQMAFPFMASPAGDADLVTLHAALERHLDAIRNLRAQAVDALAPDTRWRANKILTQLRRDPGMVALAFTWSEETADALFSALRATPGVALLTGSGARTAAGRIDRSALLASLANEPVQPGAGAFHLRLVIATDLLAEGVNLQRASVIIHLDDPWTPAALTQRVGRSARMGSRHDHVVVMKFAPSRAADALLRIPARHREKLVAARRAIAASTAAEGIRERLGAWVNRSDDAPRSAVAASTSSVEGLLARLDDATGSRLVCGVARAPRSWIITDDPLRVSRLVSAMNVASVAQPDREEIRAASTAILRWAARKSGSARLGSSAAPSAARRRLAAHLEALVDTATPTLRHITAAQVSRIRATLGSVRGAGVEFRITSLLSRATHDGDWLAEVERQLVTANPITLPEGARAELVALLFLRRRAVSAPRSRSLSPALPTASPESAETL